MKMIAAAGLGLLLTAAPSPAQAQCPGETALERVRRQQGEQIPCSTPAQARPVAVVAPARGGGAVQNSNFGDMSDFQALLRDERPAAEFGRRREPQAPAAAQYTCYRSPKGPSIFCTEVFRLRKTQPALDAKWARVNAARLAANSGPWAGLLAELRGLPSREKLERVNSWVNRRVQFTSDAGDSWSNAATTLSRQRGDCEDFAIAKLQLLRAAGYPEQDLYLTLVLDPTAPGNRSAVTGLRSANHAMLAVGLNGGYVLLDNRTNHIIDDSPHLDYTPTFTYSSRGIWSHGYPPGHPRHYANQTARVAALR